MSETILITQQDAEAALADLDRQIATKVAERKDLNKGIVTLRASRAQAVRLVNAFKPHKRGTGKLVAEESK